MATETEVLEVQRSNKDHGAVSMEGANPPSPTERKLNNCSTMTEAQKIYRYWLRLTRKERDLAKVMIRMQNYLHKKARKYG